MVCHHIYLFCLEHASFVLRAANMYGCLNLSRQVMPSSDPSTLVVAVKKLQGDADIGPI